MQRSHEKQWRWWCRWDGHGWDQKGLSLRTSTPPRTRHMSYQTSYLKINLTVKGYFTLILMKSIHLGKKNSLYTWIERVMHKWSEFWLMMFDLFVHVLNEISSLELLALHQESHIMDDASWLELNLSSRLRHFYARQRWTCRCEPSSSSVYEAFAKLATFVAFVTGWPR